MIEVAKIIPNGGMIVRAWGWYSLSKGARWSSFSYPLRRLNLLSLNLNKRRSK